jgi:hypothetical protein
VVDLFETLQQIARSGRLGQPVFLRWQVTAPPERALASLAEALAAATALFEDAPATLQAAGDEAAGALHAVLVFRSGSTVLVYTGPGEEAADVMLLGNHGAAYGPGAGGAPHAWGDQRMPDSADVWIGRFESLVRQSWDARQAVRLEAAEDA